jgi:5-methyltetrahydropteroyltriglutamate--homocysteine methyltransferase
MVPQWHREGHYDAIAERLFSELNHERFLLEYDDERSGSFEPLRFIPKGKIAVLGLVSTKTTDIETVDFLERRIDEASKYLPVEQLAISPQCGFASGIGGVTVSEDQQWRKLEVLVKTAAEVWG